MRISRGGLWRVVLFSLATVAFGADGYTVEQTIFLPPSFYVGDIVELRLRIDTDGLVLPSEPESYPESDWIEFHDLRIIPIGGEYDIRIRFSSYRPGRLEIPSFSIGPLTLAPIPFETTSIASAGELEPAGIFDPMLLPGTGLLIALTGGVVLFGPLLLLLAVGWVRRVATRIVIGVRRPYRRLKRELASLDSELSRLDAREFYRKLFDAFRSYLSDRTSYNYRAATTTEMTGRLESDFSGVDGLDSLARMAGEIDRAKYGGGESSEAEMVQRLALVRSSAEIIEQRVRASGRS
jgi:hypothetical protein